MIVFRPNTLVLLTWLTTACVESTSSAQEPTSSHAAGHASLARSFQLYEDSHALRALFAQFDAAVPEERRAEELVAALEQAHNGAAQRTTQFNVLHYLLRANLRTSALPWSAALRERVSDAAHADDAQLRRAALNVYLIRGADCRSETLRFLDDPDDHIRQRALAGVDRMPDRRAILERYTKQNSRVRARAASVKRARLLLRK